MTTLPTEQRASGGAPRHLLLVIGGLQAGGAERQLSEMANYWAREGEHVTLATWSDAEIADFYPLHDRVKRLRLDTASARSSPLIRIAAIVRAILRLRRVLRQSQPDAVVSFIDISNVCSLLAGAGLGTRLIVAERTHPAMRAFGWPWRVLRRLCYSRADCVVAQTRDAAVWLERKCRARVVVIPNSLRPLPQLQRAPEPLILAIGRLSSEKGFDLLLQAFARIRPDFPAWRVCILGEGPERGALTRRAATLQLTDCVELPGQVRDVEAWLARASLLVHPSRREGFPNVVLEAMGAGLAVICANCRAGPSELVTDGVDGRLVPVGDVAELERVMAELMAEPATRERLGREGRCVAQHYGQDAIMAQWRACVLPTTVERYATVSRAGNWARLRCRGARLWLSALRLWFGFDHWHAAASYSCRPYKGTVVELANALRPQVAVEVGCGLGDIISRIRATERIGIDADPRVIRAARFLHRSGQWLQGDCGTVLRLFDEPRTIDCLIMVNWTHNLSPAQLAGFVLPLLATTRYLIMDAVDAEAAPSYRHRHDFAFLAAVARRVSVARVPGEPRTFVVFEILQ